MGSLHYARWMMEHHPEALGGFYAVLDKDLEVNADGGGDTGAPQVKVNPVDARTGTTPTGWPIARSPGSTGWPADDDWFCWMSFPDPHHPWDPPASELGRVDWREVPLPAGYPESAAERERILDGKPRHWRLWYDGELVSNYEAPTKWVPATMTADQVREVNAVNAVEVELIDEAIGRVLAAVAARGWADDLDVVFTTDHGELQGDFGLLFKGPYHVDGLMRLPLVWRPAPSAGVAPAAVTRPVGLVDLAPTFCSIAGLPAEPWMQGQALPGRRRATPTTAASSACSPSGTASCSASRCTCARSPATAGCAPPTARAPCTTAPRASCTTSPTTRSSRSNRWDDPAARAIRDDLVADLRDHLPPVRDPRLPLEAPV